MKSIRTPAGHTKQSDSGRYTASNNNRGWLFIAHFLSKLVIKSVKIMDSVLFYLLHNFLKTVISYIRWYERTIALPTDDSLKKSIYLSIKEISKKWNQPVRHWGIIIGQFMMFYEERLVA